MADAGIFRTAHHVWQRASIMAAANYLREHLTRAPDDPRVKPLYDGLLEVLDPSRRMVRIQRELAATSAAAKASRAKRSGSERRTGQNRRRADLGPPDGLERRKGVDRRSGKDRRGR